MSGHSKWATIKRAKAATDAKRSAVFTKLANNITIAARKGGDPDSNFSLRMAMDKAKSANMPKSNIEKAIKRGTGELGGAAVEELTYEGMGPSNTQFIIKCLTDNKNRTAANIRHLFSKHGGSLTPVAWNFDQKGVISIEGYQGDFEELELELIEQDVDDIENEDNTITIKTKIKNLEKTKKFLEEKDIKIESAEIKYIPKDKLDIDIEKNKSLENFLDSLDENEDIADYYVNF